MPDRPDRLPRSIVKAIDDSKITRRARAGQRSKHRFIGIWPVVVKGRVFARSWTLKPSGWYPGRFSMIRWDRFLSGNGRSGFGRSYSQRRIRDMPSGQHASKCSTPDPGSTSSASALRAA